MNTVNHEDPKSESDASEPQAEPVNETAPEALSNSTADPPASANAMDDILEASDDREIHHRLDQDQDEDDPMRADPADAFPVPQDCSIDLTVLKLEGIQAQLDRIETEFKTKIKYDVHKDRVIDRLHEELQAYKNDLIGKQTRSMIMDIIKVLDDIRKFAEHFSQEPPVSAREAKLIEYLEELPSDLEDIFEWQGVKSFRCSDSTFDARLQRVVKKIETDDKSKDKTIAESLRPGYDWDGKVIRPEMVAVYVYKESLAETALRSSHE